MFDTKAIICIAIAYVAIEILFIFIMPIASIFPPVEWWQDKWYDLLDFIDDIRYGPVEEVEDDEEEI